MYLSIDTCKYKQGIALWHYVDQRHKLRFKQEYKKREPRICRQTFILNHRSKAAASRIHQGTSYK